MCNVACVQLARNDREDWGLDRSLQRELCLHLLDEHHSCSRPNQIREAHFHAWNVDSKRLAQLNLAGCFDWVALQVQLLNVEVLKCRLDIELALFLLSLY